MSRTLPIGRVAHSDRDVFIGLDSTVAGIKRLVAMDAGVVTFIRGPVASGKSTLARYLADHDEAFIMAGLDEEDEDTIRGGIIAACAQLVPEKSETVRTIADAVKALAKSEKTLIIDEGHLLFNYPRLIYALIKANESWTQRPSYLLFSAAASAAASGASLALGDDDATPPEILKKYMWYPPVPDGVTLASILKMAGVGLDAESVDFFMKICSGHRGIFMFAMTWVKECQQKTPGVVWDRIQSVAHVKASFERSRQRAIHNQDAASAWTIGLRSEMVKSRAVHVNGQYSDINQIPRQFAEVVFGGPKKRADLGGFVRTLTQKGFLKPVRRDDDTEEFVSYNWNSTSQSYGVANSLMAEYYCDIYPMYGMKRSVIKQSASCCADLVARAIPYMSFAAVIDNPTPSEEEDGPMSQATAPLNSSLNKGGMPFEDDYNDALRTSLTRLGYGVSEKKNTMEGKPDVTVTLDGKTFVLEGILARPDDSHNKQHNKHLGRFVDQATNKKTNYKTGSHKALYTIGSEEATVLKRMNESVHGQDVEVIGLVVSVAHDVYKMYVKPAGEEAIMEPVLLVCDLVAKSLERVAKTNVYRVVAAQELSTRQASGVAEVATLAHAGTKRSHAQMSQSPIKASSVSPLS